MNESDESLTKWVVGAVGSGVLGGFALLAKFVFGNVLDEMKSMKGEVKASNDAQYEKLEKIAEATAENRTARAVIELRLGHLEASVNSLALKYEDTANFLARDLNFKKRDG